MTPLTPERLEEIRAMVARWDERAESKAGLMEYCDDLLREVDRLRRAYAGIQEAVREEWRDTTDMAIKELAAANEREGKIREALTEAVALRVKLYRHSDMLDEHAHLPDSDVIQRDQYARRWQAALSPSTEPQT